MANELETPPAPVVPPVAETKTVPPVEVPGTPASKAAPVPREKVQSKKKFDFGGKEEAKDPIQAIVDGVGADELENGEVQRAKEAAEKAQADAEARKLAAEKKSKSKSWLDDKQEEAERLKAEAAKRPPEKREKSKLTLQQEADALRNKTPEEKEAERLEAEEAARVEAENAKTPEQKEADRVAAEKAAAEAAKNAPRDADIDAIVTEHDQTESGAKPKTKEHFKKLAAEVKAARDKAAALEAEKIELEKKIKEAKPLDPATENELTSLRQRVAEMDTESLPEIVTNFTSKIEAANTTLKDIAKRPEVLKILKAANLNADALAKLEAGQLDLNRATAGFIAETVRAAANGDIALKDLADELDSTSKNVITLQAGKKAEIDKLKTGAVERRTKAQESYTKIINDDSVAVRAMVDKELADLAKKEKWGRLETIEPTDLPAVKAQKEAFNKKLFDKFEVFKTHLQVLKEDGSGIIDQVKVAKLAMKACLADQYMEDREELRERIKQLEADLGKARSGGRTTVTSQAPPAVKPAPVPVAQPPKTARAANDMSYIDDVANDIRKGL